MLFISDWEGEPPGEPFFEYDGHKPVLMVNNCKHQNAAHQEVRPPIFGFALAFSDSPSHFRIRPRIFGFALAFSDSPSHFRIRPHDFGLQIKFRSIHGFYNRWPPSIIIITEAIIQAFDRPATTAASSHSRRSLGYLVNRIVNRPFDRLAFRPFEFHRDRHAPCRANFGKRKRYRSAVVG